MTAKAVSAPAEQQSYRRVPQPLRVIFIPVRRTRLCPWVKGASGCVPAERPSRTSAGTTSDFAQQTLSQMDRARILSHPSEGTQARPDFHGQVCQPLAALADLLLGPAG